MVVRLPKYFGVKQAVLELIAGAAPGTPIPTERELAERFTTSRTTVRQAIGELVVEGKLERTQGSGTFVARPRLMVVRQLNSFTEDLRSQGREPGDRIVDVSKVRADDEVAAHLELPAQSWVHRVERIRGVSGQPIAHEVAHLPAPLPRLAEQLSRHGSLYTALRSGYGINLGTVEDSVETTLADPLMAGLLGVETGLPMLLMHRTAWDSTGRAVEWTRSVFRGDLFKFVARTEAGSAGVALG